MAQMFARKYSSKNTEQPLHSPWRFFEDLGVKASWQRYACPCWVSANYFQNFYLWSWPSGAEFWIPSSAAGRFWHRCCYVHGDSCFNRPSGFGAPCLNPATSEPKPHRNAEKPLWPCGVWWQPEYAQGLNMSHRQPRELSFRELHWWKPSNLRP